jgi:tRNA threonylcarbamoyladenosine biosynthesis protein TsaE
LSSETTRSAGATEAAGSRLAESLKPGDVVLISGDLGAGKTTFVRGACRALGIEEPIVSPTFTIGRRYSGRLPIAHLDLFRLDGLGAEEPGLLDEYLGGDRVAFVEWPAAAEPELPATVRGVIRVSIRHLGGDEREIEIAGRDEPR